MLGMINFMIWLYIFFFCAW